MLILDATTRSLEIDLTGAVATNQLPFVASYVDMVKGTMELAAASTNTGASNSTTAVTLVAAPGANITRQLKYLSIRNADTAAVPLWIQVNDNTTLREVWKGTLAVDDVLIYTDTLGFRVMDASGGIKNSLVNSMSTLTLTSTLTMSGTAANIALGVNFISYGGTDAGFSLDASNNATLSAGLFVAGYGTFKGALLVDQTSALALCQITSTYSRIYAYGPNTTTAGSMDFKSMSSNGSIDTTLMTLAAGGAVTIPGTLALTATASPTGTGAGAAGQIAWDTAYLYVCTATNDWRRIALVDF